MRRGWCPPPPRIKSIYIWDLSVWLWLTSVKIYRVIFSWLGVKNGSVTIIAHHMSKVRLFFNTPRLYIPIPHRPLYIQFCPIDLTHKNAIKLSEASPAQQPSNRTETNSRLLPYIRAHRAADVLNDRFTICLWQRQLRVCVSGHLDETYLLYERCVR